MVRKQPKLNHRVAVTAGKRSVTPMDRTIGTRLRARRLELHISQNELAEKLGLSFQQVQKYEKGVNRVGSSRLMQIATVLQCDVGFFLASNGREHTTSKFVEFLATKDGVEINEAMMKLGDEHRRGVIELARTLVRAYGD
jgi:transcriptional regulator with XRE-family HTH domain